uniref:Uncharacterized protein n=1 Tax=Anguilla anguilla TaxID=7936 RepID=A0A0E9S2R5_ANGAN
MSLMSVIPQEKYLRGIRALFIYNF